MSNNEKMGRCYNEVYERRGRSELKIAAAIDRLAEDVASIKAKVDDIMPEDVQHFVDSEKAWVKLVEELLLPAIRKRDEALAEVERLRGELAARSKANPQEILDSSPAARQPAGQGISPGLPETQSAGNAAPAAGWLTEREQHALRHILAADVEPVIRSILARAGSPPSQTAPWWLTDEERRALSRAVHLLFDDDCDTTSARTIQALLSRAGSPPVVVVPALGFLGGMTGREQGIVLAYRDALDKAGVTWKGVGRE